ncbi:MAG: short-chain dehydrogenase [Planctomycetes bacterium RBG_13_63_9]|nr:MAG: short-chain dehydrogenase [Planctomycetes bacterium RBG_13_63_9]
MQVDLSQRVALVTGAARGIGKAIAAAMAQNGARVFYTDRDRAEAEESASEWPSATAAEMDVTNEAQIQAVTDAIVRECGRIDILVNNAGVNTLAHRVPIDQFPRDEWDRIVGVDLTGLYLVSKVVAAEMRSQRSGRIINIASIAGLVPLRLQSPFVAAKAGVVNLTKSMAIELGAEGILVNAIAPGSILTEGTRELFYGEEGKFRGSMSGLLAHIPLGRPGTVEEVAHAALFLAAPEASYINGAVLTVDGGWTAGYARDF